MKKWQVSLLLVLAIIAVAAVYVFVQVRTIKVERLSDDLFVLRGLGGNTAVLRTDAGAVVVDTMTLPMQGSRIRELARELTGMDTVLLINTHYHLDHTHGNPAFPAGLQVISTDRTRARSCNRSSAPGRSSSTSPASSSATPRRRRSRSMQRLCVTR